MRNICMFFLAVAPLALNACNSSAAQDFARMSPPELIAYNRSVKVMDQVYCADEIRAGSHIRRRHCETIIEIQERVAKAAGAINILGTAQIY